MPQLNESPLRLTQDCPHAVLGAEQVLTQLPLEQNCEPPHFTSQPPQLLGSSAGLTTQLLLQEMPTTQTQVEPTQTLPSPQKLPQAPQSSRLFVVLTQVPSQSVGRFAGHEAAHFVPVQTSVPVQVVLQLPQSAGPLGTQVPLHPR